jgi:hypothetical protein
MPTVITTDTYLVLPAAGGLAEVVFNTPAWNAWDYSGFFDGAEMVGANRPIPGGATLAVKHEPAEKIVLLPVDVWGGHDQNGTTNTDEIAGLRANLLFLRTNLLAIPATADGTRPAEFHHDGVTDEGPVTVLTKAAWSPESGDFVRGVFRIKIPAGNLA